MNMVVIQKDKQNQNVEGQKTFKHSLRLQFNYQSKKIVEKNVC